MYIFIIFFLIFLLDFIVTINIIQRLAAILIRINYLSIYLLDLTPRTYCSLLEGLLLLHDIVNLLIIDIIHLQNKYKFVLDVQTKVSK